MSPQTLRATTLDKLYFDNNEKQIKECLNTFLQAVEYRLANKETEDAVLKEIASDAPISATLYSLYSQTLRKAIDDVPFTDTTLADRLRANVSRFAAYKAYHATQTARNETEPKRVLQRFNRHLAAEYNTTTIRAHRAADWQQFEAERDVLPNLEWMPSTSINPGEDHRTFWGTTLPIDDPFWEEHCPGDRWNCKCHLRNTDKEPTDRPTSDNPCDLRHDGFEGNPAHTGEIFTDNATYIKSCNRKKKNLVQRYAGDKFLRRETQQSLREVQGKSISLKKQNEQIDVLFDSKTTSHLANDVAQSSQFLWNEILKDIKSVLKKSKLVAHEPNRKLDKKPSAVEYFYYEYKINGKSLFISVEENFVKNEYRHFYRLYAISNTLRDSVIFY